MQLDAPSGTPDTSELVDVDTAVAELGGSTPSEADFGVDDQNAAPDDELATAEPEDGTLDPSEPEAEAPEGDSGLQKLKEFVDSAYKGNVDEFLRGIRESWSSQSRLARELAEIKAQLAGKAQAEPEPIPEVDPDLEWFDTEISGITTEMAGYQQEANGIIQTLAKNRNELAALEGELRRADEYDRKDLLRSKRDLEREAFQLEKDYKSLQRDARMAQSRQRELELRKKATEREVSVRTRLKQQEAEQRVSAQAQTVDIFTNAVAAQAKTAGIAGTKAEQHMTNVIRAELVTYLRSMPEGAPGIDIPAFVAAKSRDYLDAYTEVSRAKLRTVKKPAPAFPSTTPQPARAAAPAAAGKPTSTRITAEDVRARAARLLP